VSVRGKGKLENTRMYFINRMTCRVPRAAFIQRATREAASTLSSSCKSHRRAFNPSSCLMPPWRLLAAWQGLDDAVWCAPWGAAGWEAGRQQWWATRRAGTQRTEALRTIQSSMYLPTMHSKQVQCYQSVMQALAARHVACISLRLQLAKLQALAVTPGCWQCSSSPIHRCQGLGVVATCG
jgi:hypothetical protein